MTTETKPHIDMKPEKLVEWRLLMGWSKTRAAEEIGLSRNFYSDCELGKKNPIPRYVQYSARLLTIMEAHRKLKENPITETRSR